MEETFIQNSTNWCKSFVEINASQLQHFSMCQSMPIGLYTRWELDSETGNFKRRQNKMRSFRNMVMSYFQRVRPQCKVEIFYATGRQKKIHILLMTFLDTSTLCLKLWVAVINILLFKKLVLIAVKKKFGEGLGRKN